MSTEELHVPAQVKKAAKQARELQELQRKEREAAAAPPAETPPAETPPETPPAAPAAAAPPPPPPPEENWEHKYSVLQGRFVRETSEVREENARLKAELEAAKKAATPAAPPPSLISEQEIAEYTPDLTDFIRRVARSEFTPVLEEQVGDLRKRVDMVSNTASVLTQEQMVSKCDDLMPEWREQNNNLDFVAWLQHPDDMSGQVRQKLLQHAWDHFQPERFIKIFKAWPGYNKPAAAAPPPAPTPEPRPTAAQFAAPGAGGAPPAGAPPRSQPKTYTKKQVDDFFMREVRTTPYSKMTAAEAEKMRAELTLAAIEGRVTQ